MLIAIEHLTEKLWRWLYIEYKNAIKLSSSVIITNLPEKYHHLFPAGRIFSKSVFEMFPLSKIIILDPQAGDTLTPNALHKSNNDVIVVGGILGYDPPEGRTYKLLTSKFPDIKSYNIGDRQLSIDSAVYVALKIAEGVDISNIRFVDNVYVLTTYGSLVKLPYRYPIIGNKPFISDELIRLIRNYGLPFSIRETNIWGEVK